MRILHGTIHNNVVSPSFHCELESLICYAYFIYFIKLSEKEPLLNLIL